MAIVKKPSTSAAPASKPVVKSDAEAAPKTRKPKAVKPAFALTSATAADGSAIKLDDKGRLTALPANWNPSFKPISGKSFANRADRLLFKAILVDAVVTRLQEKAARLRERAANPGKAAVSNERKAKKLEKLRSQIAELEAALAADGIKS